MTEVETPTVEGKLIDMLDALQNGAVMVGEQVVKYAPDVADAALLVVRVDGIQSVVTGVLFLVVAAAINMTAVRTIWKSIAADPYRDRSDNVRGGFLTAVYNIPSFLAAERLLDVWTWVAIFEPKFWLAKQIVASVIK